MTAPASVTDEWIEQTADSLFADYRFRSGERPFLLDPVMFDSAGGYREQVLFLIKRHELPYLDLHIYMHADLTSGGRECSGLAQYPMAFDVSVLDPVETLISVTRDRTHTTLDLSDPTKPVLLMHRTGIGHS